ncbi:hypothetical protein GGX14DRAFT_377334 [Mycena pura]|uniref:Protein kinase domain-containing protein n=1 Tax=Mycena pura TaxID=153505 RepID=A0AAD6Y5G7_9AGAR|nr:hypothetical protein GGX14DRAFT_377334 [Mycena pura]
MYGSDDEGFLYTQVLFESAGEYYSSRSAQRMIHLTADSHRELFRTSTLVPVAFYKAPISAGGTLAPAVVGENVFFKAVRPSGYSSDVDLSAPWTPANRQQHEMEIAERLSLDQHANICRYLGYRPSADGAFVAGLCYERHIETLLAAVNAQKSLSPTFLDEVQSALEHLHRLGFAHNDINPTNVMISLTGAPVLIDFDSCLELGRPLSQGARGSTYGWEYPGSVSAVENDMWALARMRQWVANPKMDLYV